MPVGAIGAIAGGVISAFGAKKAADAQSEAAAADRAFQIQTRNMIRRDLSPWRNQGGQAQNALAFELGLANRPNNYGGFKKTQDYTFGLNEGINSVQAGAAARGGLYSGAAMKALNQWGQDYGSQRRDTYLNRLANMSGVGMNAAGMNASAAQNAAAGVSNALGNMGNAQSAGYIGMGNALNDGIGNLVGAWQYQQGLGGRSGVNVGGNLFGGNSWG